MKWRIGFVDSSRTSFRSNRSLLKNKKGVLEILNDLAIYSKQPIYKFKKSTPELLEGIRAYKIEENKQLDAKRRRLLITCCAFFMVIIGYIIFYGI